MSPHLNYFTAKEQQKQSEFSQKRSSLLSPLVSLMSSLGLTANSVSLLSLLSTAGFVYFAPEHMLLALLFILIHILLDGLDGPLARKQGTAGNAGAFTDICVDQAGLLVVLLTLIHYELAESFSVASYGLLYIIMITFMVILNERSVHLPTIIRSKYLLYIVLLIEALWPLSILNQFLGLFALYMLAFNLYLFQKLRLSLS